MTEAHANPKALIDDSGHELRAFTLTLSSNAGPARGQGHGSFSNSVLAAVEKFYTDVVQHLKSWAPAPPKVRDDEIAGPEDHESPIEIPQAQPSEMARVGDYAALP